MSKKKEEIVETLAKILHDRLVVRVEVWGLYGVNKMRP